jgi:hypothetical protein
MAGTDARFDATAFRDGITFAMQMGTPPDPTIAAVFVFPEGAVVFTKDDVVVTNPPLDRDGYPFDPEIKRTPAPGARVTVNCAIEMVKADQEEIPVGSFRPVKAIVTLLDVDYALVKGCKEIILNGDTYAYGYEPGAMGLFEVGVHQMIFYAVQET